MITRNSPSLIKAFKDKISTQFRITDLGPISWLLGMKVVWDHTTRTTYIPVPRAVHQSDPGKIQFHRYETGIHPTGPACRIVGYPPKTTTEIAQMRNIPYR